MPYLYKKNITADNQQFLFASLGVTLDNLTLPAFVNAPIINILSVQGDAVVNLHPDNPPTNLGFSVIIGSVGQVPSATNPIPFWFEIISQDEEAADPTGHIKLITKSFVKDNLPNWETYCTRADGLKTAEEMLQIAIDRSEDEFLSYITVTETTIIDLQKAMLLKLVKYRCWNFLHGDTEFKNTPQIVKDYETIIERLKKGVVGKGVTMTAKDRMFDKGKWFTDNDNLWYE